MWLCLVVPAAAALSLSNHARWVLDSQKSVLAVKASTWHNAPGNGHPAVYLDASIAGRPHEKVGGCGVEVVEMSHDGLQGDDLDLGRRAVVSGTLHVNQSYRRQGVAQRLLHEAEGRARMWGCGEMVLLVKRHNAPALKLYEKMGYTRCRVTPDHRDEVCMKKHLFLPTLHNALSMLPQYNMVRHV